MEPASALADLTEISSQIRTAVVFGDDGRVLASTCAADRDASRLARIGLDLLSAGSEVLLGADRRLTQVDVALPVGSVFVVRDEDRGIAATAAAGSPSGLVLYDLRSCLRALGEAGSGPERESAERESAERESAERESAETSAPDA